jgi:hypothetical protein
MTVTLRFALLLCGLSLSSLTFANDLSGFWKAEDQPAWIEIQTSDESATGVVRRNDVNADAVGRTLLKDVTAESGSSGGWRGQIYAARLGEYRDAEISLLDASTMQIEVKVGIMSRAFTWQRVEEIPAE